MKRILITRSPHQASELAECVRAAGFEAVLVPTIEIVGPTSFGELDSAIAGLAEFDWVVFTSANAVEAFRQRVNGDKSRSPTGMTERKTKATAGFVAKSSGEQSWFEPGGRSFDSTPQKREAPLRMTDLRETVGLRIAAIGTATAAAVTEWLERAVDLVPAKAVAESLAEALVPFAKNADGSAGRFLLPRAEAARDVLPDVLMAAGAEVTIATAYRTVVPKQSAAQMREMFADEARWPDAVLFTSSSTVHNLFHMLEGEGIELPLSVKRVSIGPITSQTLRERGFPPDVEAREATISSLVEALEAI